MAKQQVAAAVLGITIGCAVTAASSNKPIEAVVVVTTGVVATHVVNENKEADGGK